jgi:hypothetical protein
MIATVTMAKTAHVDIARIRIPAMETRVALVEIGGRPYNWQKAIRWAGRHDMMSTAFKEFEHCISERSDALFGFGLRRDENEDCVVRRKTGWSD